MAKGSRTRRTSTGGTKAKVPPPAIRVSARQAARRTEPVRVDGAPKAIRKGGGSGRRRQAHRGAPGPADGEPREIIQLKGVTKRFGSHTVLSDITFGIPKGQITAIMGPSGTGKSVLLKNIIGLLRPEAGEIWVDGVNIVGLPERELYKVRRKLGVLFQDGALFGSMNIYDNVAFPLREHTRKGDDEIKQIVHEKCEMVGLMDHLTKLPGEISGGMKKRAGLARALAMDPEIVLFDEPDSGLDPVRVAYLDHLVKETQAKTGATFVIITHNIPSVMRTADFIAVLFRSNLVRAASKQEMIEDTNPVLRQFLAGLPKGPIGMDEMATADDDDWTEEDFADAPVMTV